MASLGRSAAFRPDRAAALINTGRSDLRDLAETRGSKRQEADPSNFREGLRQDTLASLTGHIRSPYLADRCMRWLMVPGCSIIPLRLHRRSGCITMRGSRDSPRDQTLMLRPLLVSIAFCLWLPVGARPANATPGPEEAAACTPDTCYTQAEAQEDLSVLYRQLRENHFDLYARRSAGDYDRHYQALLKEIDGPIPRARFHRILHRLLAYGNVGHAKTEVALLDGLAHIRQGGRVIPLSIRYHDDEMILEEWADDSEALPPGATITSLGGLELRDFETRARALISADTDRLLRAQLEMGLPIYLYLLFGDVEDLEIGFIRPDGVRGNHRVPVRTYKEIMALAQARPVKRPDFDGSTRAFRPLGDDVFYLRPGPFSATAEERGEDGAAYAIDGFRAFIDKAFDALAQSKAGNLLIDLRGNGGGDVSFSDLLIARLADRPFTFASRYAVRAGERTKLAWSERESPAESLSGRIARGIANAETGATFEVDLPLVPPAETGRFQGQVWVLVNRHSYSNAAVVAAQIQDYGFGTLMGESTADLATTYGAVESFALPHSEAVVYYPKAYMVRPNGDETVGGVRPNVPLPPQPVGTSEDRVLAAALAHIRSR